MGEMISMIAHQWRQPLSAINSSIIGIESKLAIGKYDMEDKNHRDKFLKFLDKKHKGILEYVQGLSNTIDEFRNFFKPDKQKQTVSLIEPIQKALKIVKVSMSSKGISIKGNFSNRDELELYNNEIMQVILNILKNAEDNFIEKGIQNPTIKIETLSDEKEHIIKITDNGGGIPKDILPNIFDPYFSTKDEKNGTGLGLYMSKIIIEDHHKGKFKATNIENGVCFEIRFKK
jgi:signal transduction histidine kinase